MLDALLVPIDKQVKIRFSNFRIALEKSQPDVIYKFWHTLHYDLTAKAYLFIIDDQTFEVNADLLSKALQITLEVSDCPFIIPPLKNEIVSFINKLGYSGHLTTISGIRGMVTVYKQAATYLAFGMPIPIVMLNDDIKASTAYVEYLSKSSGTQLAKGRGKSKGRITKKDLEVALNNIRVPKKKRTETVFEETPQSEVHQESDEKALDHSKKLKGVERMSKTAEFLLQLRKAKKESKQEFILQQRPRGSSEGSGVTSKFQLNSDENDGASDKEKDEAEKAEEEQAREDHTMTELAKIKQPEKVQAKESVPKPQFINDNPEVSLTDVLKEPEAEVQSLVDVLIKPEKAAKQSMPKYSATPFDQAALDEYDQKEKLLKLMRKSKSYDKHPHHRALYDTLMLSLIVDEDDMDKHLEEQSTLKKIRRDDQDQDPPSDLEKEKKKRKHKDSESSKKDKDQAGSSKKGKSPSKSSNTDKSVHADETVHDVEMDARESVEEYVVDIVDPSQADASVPKRDTLFWFKQPMVKRPESPDPEWYKEPTVDDAPE
ncbi:hypothetical protein Tco_1058075 [Tanacetum coccineum]|uniref:Uncharacterized protein n=1 Tax=Tanacetum coccineum TaxID=301880 RepID=A0ABQ5H7B0_9ASTR